MVSTVPPCGWMRGNTIAMSLLRGDEGGVRGGMRGTTALESWCPPFAPVLEAQVLNSLVVVLVDTAPVQREVQATRVAAQTPRGHVNHA